MVTCPTTVDGSELSTTTKRPLPTVPCVGTECPDNGFKDDSSFTDDCIGVTSTETLSTTSENEITTNDSITTSAPAESDSTTTKKSPPTEPCQGLECLETSSSQTNSMMTTQQHPNYTEPTTDTENSSEFISTLIPHSTSDESITEDQLSSTSPTVNYQHNF